MNRQTLKGRLDLLESTGRAVEQTALAKLRKGFAVFEFEDQELLYLLTGSPGTVPSDEELQGVARGGHLPGHWRGVLGERT